MPYVNVPNDLSKIKTKMAFNLTKRQLVCFGSAGAVGNSGLSADPWHPRQYRGDVSHAGNYAPGVPAGHV